jgi:hypothetical protein
MVVAAETAAPSVRPTDGWLNAKEVREWLTSNNFAPPRTLYIIDKWDIYAALEEVSSSIKRISRRGDLKARKTLRFYPTAWIKGVRDPKPIPTNSPVYTLLPGYQIEAPSLVSRSSDDRLDVAVEFIEAAATVEGPSALECFGPHLRPY